MSKEVRIGILVSVTALFFFLGFYFLKGRNVFSPHTAYHGYYKNVDGLMNSANIQLNGVNVGHVVSLTLEGAKGVRVDLLLNGKMELPTGTTANLSSSDLIGTKVIKLVLGPGPGVIAEKSELNTVTEGGLMDNVSAQLTPRLRELKSTIESLDTVLASVSNILGDDNRKALSSAIDNINVTSANLAKLSGALSAEGGQISSIIKNANSITGNLAKENDTINRILTNVNTLSRQLASAPIEKTMADLQHMTADLQGIASKINSNQGTLGLLINTKDVHNNLNSTLQNTSRLMEDLKANPKRYINFSVFGGKEK